jgi:hypothetical protein
VIEQQYNIEIKLSVTGCIKRCSIHLRESCNHQLVHTLGTCCPGSTSTRTSSRCSRPPLPISSQLLLPSLHHSPQQQLVGAGGLSRRHPGPRAPTQLLLPSLHHSPQQQLVGAGGCRAVVVDEHRAEARGCRAWSGTTALEGLEDHGGRRWWIWVLRLGFRMRVVLVIRRIEKISVSNGIKQIITLLQLKFGSPFEIAFLLCAYEGGRVLINTCVSLFV